MPSYLKPLVRRRNIWRRVYFQPHTGTCRRQIASARTRTALRPPHGFCPVKRRIKERNYCSRLKGSFRYAQPALVKLNNYCIGRETLSIGPDYFATRDQKMHSLSKYACSCYGENNFWRRPASRNLFRCFDGKSPTVKTTILSRSICVAEWVIILHDLNAIFSPCTYIYNLTSTLRIVPGHNCLAREAKCTLKAQITWRV